MGPEAKIEAYLVKSVKDAGGMAVKNKGTRGFPDRTVLLNGLVVFIEVKAEGEEPRPEQIRMFTKISAIGCMVFVIDSKDRVDDFMVFMLQDMEEDVGLILPEHMNRMDS